MTKNEAKKLLKGYDGDIVSRVLQAFLVYDRQNLSRHLDVKECSTESVKIILSKFKKSKMLSNAQWKRLKKTTDEQIEAIAFIIKEGIVTSSFAFFTDRNGELIDVSEYQYFVPYFTGDRFTDNPNDREVRSLMFKEKVELFFYDDGFL